MTHDEIIAKYIQIRDKKQAMEKEHKEHIAKYTEAMTKIEQYMLGELTKAGLDSMKAKTGTAYKSLQTRVKVDDPEIFRKFIQEHKAWDLSETRASKTAVEQYLEENEDVPPGVSVTRFYNVRFNRP